MNIFLYLILKKLFQEQLNDSFLMLITIIACTPLQVFSAGKGIQIESLFILLYVIVCYQLIKIVNKDNYLIESFTISVSSIIAYITNS